MKKFGASFFILGESAMAAESLYDPIPREKIRAARSMLAYAELTIEDWAKANGFKPKAVYQVLSGNRMAIRGAALKIAIALGLRPQPPGPKIEGLPGRETPAGRTGDHGDTLPMAADLAGGRPVASCDRPPFLQPGPAPRRRGAAGALGEPVR